MKVIDYYELALPDYSLSYLVNGDGSGLEPEDIETIDAWHADMQAKAAANFPGCHSDLILRHVRRALRPWPSFFPRHGQRPGRGKRRSYSIRTMQRLF